MIRIVLFLALLGGIAFAVGQVAETPGHMLLQWGDTEYRVSLVVGLLGLAGAMVALMLVWSVLRLVFRLPSLIGLYNRMRRQARGQEAVARGLLAVGTGDERLALRHARDSQRLLGKAPLSLLLQAQAAQLAGDSAQAERSFRAMLEAPETRDLGLRGLYIEAERRGDAAAARLFAEDALRRAPDSAWAGDALLLMRACEQDWRGALALVDQRISRRRVSKDEGRRQRAVLLAAAARDVQDKDVDEAFSLAQQALKAAPGLVPAAEIAARRLAARGDYARAAKVLEAAYKENPHPDLAEAYLNVRHGDSALDRLKRARYLAKLAPDARESRFVVARAALDAREFALARETLDALVLEKASVRACLLMAELEEAEGGHQGLVRAWLARASCAPRDPVWVADGMVSESWVPVAPVSGRIGGFEWREPPHAPEQEVRARIDVSSFETAAAEPPVMIEARAEPEVIPESAPLPGHTVIEPVARTSEPALSEPSSEHRPEPSPEASMAVERASPGAPAAQALPFFDPQTGEIRPIVPDDPGPDPEAAPKKKRFSFFG